MHYFRNVCLVGLLLLLTGSPVQAQREELIKYLQVLDVKDYLELDEGQSKILTKLLSHARTPNVLSSRAKIVFKKSLYVQHSWVVAEVHHLAMIPGASSASVYFIDDMGDMRGANHFTLGYRVDCHSIKVSKYPDIDDYTLEIGIAGQTPSHFLPAPLNWQPTGYPNPEWITYQTYALKNNQAKLIRVVNGNGAYQPNNYVHKHFTYGPLPQFTVKDVLRQMESRDIVDQLGVMVWFSGVHRDNHYKGENLENAALFDEARKQREVHEKLQSMLSHPSYQVREMAKYTLFRINQRY